MLLERIFLKTGDCEPVKETKNEMSWVWVDNRRCQASPFTILTDELPAFNQTAISLAGVSTENRKVMNPQDLPAVHQLDSTFASYKYTRLKYVYSDWGNNRLSY